MANQLTDSRCDKSILHSISVTVTVKQLLNVRSHCLKTLTNTVSTNCEINRFGGSEF